MYRSEISMRLSRGISTPAMRAMLLAPLARNRESSVESGELITDPQSRFPARTLPLSLLVPRVLADDPDHAVAADHLAFLATRLYRCLNFHVTPLLLRQQSAHTSAMPQS